MVAHLAFAYLCRLPAECIYGQGFRKKHSRRSAHLQNAVMHLRKYLFKSPVLSGLFVLPCFFDLVKSCPSAENRFFQPINEFN
jgi:hypothetical protein